MLLGNMNFAEILNHLNPKYAEILKGKTILTISVH